MPKVFLSYRRKDQLPNWEVKRIGKMCKECGFDEVFVDRDTGAIPPGSNYRQEIEKAIRAADATLVLIGDKWQAILDEKRGDPHDMVQVEIGLSMELGKVVVPILLGGGMPAVNDLPERLREFHFCNGGSFDQDNIEERMPVLLRQVVAGLDRRKVEEARRLAENAARRQEERKLAEEEAARKREQERKLAEEAAKRLEAQRQAEEAARKQEERRRAEEEANKREKPKKPEEKARRQREESLLPPSEATLVPAVKGALTKLPFPAYQGADPYIFAAYAHADSIFVYPELDWLHQMGYRVWYDEGIVGGWDWTESIAEAIDNCAQYLVFMSPRATASLHVREETYYAFNKNKKILPVHLQKAELSAGLKMRLDPFQQIFMHDLSEDDYRRKLRQALVAECRSATGR